MQFKSQIGKMNRKQIVKQKGNLIQVRDTRSEVPIPQHEESAMTTSSHPLPNDCHLPLFSF